MPLLGHPFRLALAATQTIALCHVTWAFGFSITPGSGPSMLPTFMATNEWFVTDKRFRRGRGVRVGDCVAYSIPVDPGEEALKRIIGMPGDYVLLNSPPSLARGGRGGGMVTAAGDEVEGKGSGTLDRAGRGLGTEDMLQVPQGHCYVVGDNLPWSRDSRDYGPIPLALIKGKIIATVSVDSWNPINWFTKVENGVQKPIPARSAER
ncbi:LexA/Signal peptidase [Xylariaceae sp. FL0255]|nr:LexA/Signal peptidase [Xylariaceae sp. FL0255]